MISFSVKLSGNIDGFEDPRVALGDDGFLTLGQERMQEVADFAIRTIKNRVADGIGSDDSPMPALKVHARAGATFTIRGQSRQLLGYPQWKSNHGLKPIRDLRGNGKDGGNMLDNISVRYVSGSTATISITSRIARAKALANEKRSPWFSFSDNDGHVIAEFYTQYTGFVAQALLARVLKPLKLARVAA